MTKYNFFQADYKSPNMERLGLCRSLEFLVPQVPVREIVPDASISIIAMLGIHFAFTQYFQFIYVLLISS